MQPSASEVVIVGAGLIGASIAWRLAQFGIAVRLVDAGIMGGEASSAGAGMLSPGGEFRERSVWLDLGREGMRLYPSFIEELRAESGVPIDFRICGTQYFAVDDAERSAARATAEFHKSSGIRVDLNEQGLFYPDDACVDPSGILIALRAACLAREVRLIETTPIHLIECAEHRAVVIAAGAWSGNLGVIYQGRRRELPGTVPVKGHLIGFDLRPGSLPAMLRHRHTYVIQRSNGFTIAGSTEEDAGFDRSVDPDVCEEIHQRAARLFAPLVSATLSKAWIGFRPRDANGGGPHIGRLSDGNRDTNVWLAYGHYRNGILLAPLTAQRIAADIARSL